jgi:hypothetical protein
MRSKSYSKTIQKLPKILKHNINDLLFVKSQRAFIGKKARSFHSPGKNILPEKREKDEK